MWEGHCARGLCMLYGKLHDGSAQVNYAKQAYDAYLKSGDKEWAAYSKFALAKAYNNNCKYEESLKLLEELEGEFQSNADTIMHSQLLQLKALGLFGLGKYKECIESYASAFEFNPSVLTDNDKKILEIAFNEVSNNSNLGIEDWYKDFAEIKGQSTNIFSVLESQGRYEEAYKNLKEYKNIQDSVLSVVFSNDVSESINNYETMKNKLVAENAKIERMSYWFVILIIVLAFIVVVWRVRERIHREESLRLKTEADMESMRSDLLAQMESVKLELEKASNIPPRTKTEDFEKIIKQRYADANRLCDDYYQGRVGKSDKEELGIKISNILKVFSEKSSLEEIAQYVDEKSGGLYASFKKDFYDLSEENFRLFLYLMLGFSARTISVILGQEIGTVYNKKSRLKTRILKSDIFDRNKYLKFF